MRDREKTRAELEFAILRVKNKGQKITITEVAEEAGVTPGLIHNTYPDIAEQIRAMIGRSVRQQRDEKAEELVQAREALKTLRAELKEAERDIQRLASINETIREELTTLRATSGGKVAFLPLRNDK